MLRPFRSLEWCGDRLRILDQRQIPDALQYLDLTDAQMVNQAIRDMSVRGAPAIGAAAAYGLVLNSLDATENATELLAQLQTTARLLIDARPTAVNLRWAVERVLRAALCAQHASAGEIRSAVLAEADSIYHEDIQINRALGDIGNTLVPERARILHHCNTGSLATVDRGTALGIIRTAHERGKAVHVFVDETRPRMQGARLTAWELTQFGIEYTLIVDGAAAHMMRTVGIDLCLVGCDRVAANGDVANKIGTYMLAIAAKAHGVPFYVAAPTATVDLATASGADIDIEQRPASEITHVGDTRILPESLSIANPAFDITPAEYITGIVTDKGVVYPPYTSGLERLFADPREARKGEGQ